MAKKREKPEADDKLGGSQSVRVAGDLARMVSWICDIEDVKSAELLDPIIRKSIEARYERIKLRVEEIEAIKLKARAESKQK